MALVNELNQAYPSSCSFVLSVREQYADWRYTLDKGYIRYHVGSVVKYEHKLVAEIVHGPKPDGWHVHHIDNNPLNNDIMNLAYLSNHDHGRIHSPSQSMYWCEQCGAEFWRHHSAIQRANKSYCSIDCARKAQRPSKAKNKPSKSELQRLLNDVGNFCELGRMFGVSDNAVRKWAKRYELSIAHVDGRKSAA